MNLSANAKNSSVNISGHFDMACSNRILACWRTKVPMKHNLANMNLECILPCKLHYLPRYFLSSHHGMWQNLQHQLKNMQLFSLFTLVHSDMDELGVVAHPRYHVLVFFVECNLLAKNTHPGEPTSRPSVLVLAPGDVYFSVMLLTLIKCE